MTGAKKHPALVARESGRLVHGLDPFELFCAYHLGLFPDGSVKLANVHQVAVAFGVDVDDVRQALKTYALDADRLVHSAFDVVSAQGDIQVSPPGVDLVGLAEMHFEALVTTGGGRDWASELDAAARENDAIFRGPSDEK